MMTNQLNQASMTNGEDHFPLLNSNVEDMQINNQLENNWGSEDPAKPIGNVINITGEGDQKKFHYKTFEFHGQKYDQEDSVLLYPEDMEEEPYVAIIKDIYVKGKEGDVQLGVHWFYRLEDIDEKLVAKSNSKDPRDLFYSFHRDEVPAESVRDSCIVNFIPASKHMPNRNEFHGFVVTEIYDPVNKKLRSLNYKYFNKIQKNEVDLRVAKTILK